MSENPMSSVMMTMTFGRGGDASDGDTIANDGSSRTNVFMEVNSLA
jgi:hypothetical protein